MILVIIALLSLSTIYITRLLCEKKMKVAAMAVAILYGYLIVWIYSVFVLDVANLGFADKLTGLSLLNGSRIYHSFSEITNGMGILPLPVLRMIVMIVALTLGTSLTVVFHGLLGITSEVIRYLHCKKIFKNTKKTNLFKERVYNVFEQFASIRFLCRMNC